MITNKMKKKICIAVLFFLCNLQILSASDVISTMTHERKFYPVRERLSTMSLNGTWKIQVFEGLEIPTHLKTWKESNYNDASWNDIKVPGNWETQGLKVPEYGVEIAEYTGLYRKSFNYQPSWKGKNVILRFDGVHFSYEVFVNGQKAGQWGSAYNLCQFDITRYLYSDKKNTLCVKVTSRSMGWKFDTNDCWGLIGITRDVELFTVNNTYLEDVTFVSDVTTDLDAIVRLQVDINNFNESEYHQQQLNIALSDLQNNHILEFSHPLSKEIRNYKFEGIIKQPALWTAETPNLYRLEVRISDKKGDTVQQINEFVGIRSISVEGFDLKVNHQPILLRGVCLNEIDPKSGRALSFEERRSQLLKMKEANINYIRTAHYPFAPDFLKLCDELGFYVCCEVPFGSRGAENLSKSQFIPELQARAEATIRRDKNHPSVIIWSLGNENPYTSIVSEVIKYVKEKDPTRPRGLPQKVGEFMRFIEKPDKNVDIIMGHYLSDARIDKAVAKSKKPILHTEYAHAQGNAFSDLENKYARILKEEKVIGGSIWCWSDQAVLADGSFNTDYEAENANKGRDAQRKLPKEYQGVKIDSNHFMDTFGERGADGIVYADGYPKENFYQVRKLYSPIVVSPATFIGELNAENIFTIELENRFDFKSLHGYQMKWKIRNLQTVLQTGNAWLDIPARKKKKIDLKVQLPLQIPFNDIMLCLEFIDPYGKRIHERNFPISIKGYPKGYASWNEGAKYKLKNKVSKQIASSDNGNYSYSISKEGIFTVSDGRKKMLETPLFLRVGRKETLILKAQLSRLGSTFNWNPYLLEPIIEKFETHKKDNGVQITLFCRWNGKNAHSDQYISGEVNIYFPTNGKAIFDYELRPSANATGNFLECGLTLDAGDSYEQFNWLGEGPYSATPGKSAYNERDIWRLHRDDIRFDGNRKNVDVGVLTNGKSGIIFLSGNGNIGIENKDGRIYVSQNAIVSGYGNKFSKPNALVPMKDLVIKGSLTLFMENLDNSSSLGYQIFKSFPAVVPEKPYMRTYGW